MVFEGQDLQKASIPSVNVRLVDRVRGAYLDTISAEGVVDNSYRGQNSNMHMCEVGRSDSKVYGLRGCLCRCRCF